MRLITGKKIATLGLVIASAFILAACTKQGVTSSTSANQQAPAASEDTTGAIVVTYNNGSYSPSPANAKVGQKVIFKNDSASTITVNSDPHPIHNLYPELNVGQIEAGQSKSTTFAKAGKYTYHNHLSPSEKGEVDVQ